jgi:hypothetical protein
LNFKFRAWRQGVIASSLNSANVKKGVASTIAEFYETKALVIFKPFYNGFDGGTFHRRRRRGVSKTTATKWGPGWPTLSWGIISKRDIIIKTALARTPEISTFAHVTCSSPPKPARLLCQTLAPMPIGRLT